MTNILFLQKKSLIFAKIMSFLALLCLIVNFYLVICLSNYFPPAPDGIIVMISLFSFIGVLLGSFLCPLFLSSQFFSDNKSHIKAITFVLLVILPNVILRSMGVGLWINSMFIMGIVHIHTGILYPICCGLFLQIHMYEKHNNSENRTGRFGAFLFALAMSGGVFFRHIYLSLVESSSIISGPLEFLSLSYNISNWIIAFIGVCILTYTVLSARFAHIWSDTQQLLNDDALSSININNTNTIYIDATNIDTTNTTNWSMILRLIGLAVIFKILNSVMEMRLFPRFIYSVQSFDLHPIVQGIAVPIIALLASRSINRFLKVFIPVAISIFVLLPCLLFFEDYPMFILFMDILVGLLNNLIWVIFTIALIEHYAGGFWFFGLAAAIHFTSIFPMLSPMINRFIPADIGFTVLISGIAAVLFIFFALRIVFPKDKSEKINIVIHDLSLEETFRKHGLTKREIEIATMIVEGLDNEAIAKRLLRATITVKNHLTSIYKKFGVKGRAEFLAMLLKIKHQ